MTCGTGISTGRSPGPEVEACEIYDRAGVTFTAVPPRDLKVEGFAELPYRYHDAGEARRALAQAAA